MALVKISRGADIQHNYVNGVCDRLCDSLSDAP